MFSGLTFLITTEKVSCLAVLGFLVLLFIGVTVMSLEFVEIFNF
jgi:hypothetical protein